MRLVFLSYHFSPDIHSPEEWFRRIGFYTGWAEILAENHEVFRIDQIDYEGEVMQNGIHYHFMGHRANSNYFPRALNRFVLTLNPDVVVISSFQYPLQLIQLRRCLGKKVRIIVQNHAEKPSSGIKKIIQNLASRQADAFLFTNFVTGLEWKTRGNIHSEKKVKELQEVSSSFYPHEKKLSISKTNVKGSPVFLWVGRLNQNKDPLTVVGAFLRFNALQPLAHLYMIYQFDELLPEIRRLIGYYKLKDSITLIGCVPHQQLLYWYSSADFYLSGSHYEGSGTALCEAMSCGCVPIVTNIPSFRKIGGSTGLFYEPGDELGLLSKMRQTMDLKWAEMRSQAISRFENELSFKSISIKFQEIMRSL